MSCQSSYEMVDRFLRNNLCDDDYAEYSAALDSLVCDRQPLTDEQIEDLYFDNFSMGELKAFARAIEAAHGIKE